MESIKIKFTVFATIDNRPSTIDVFGDITAQDEFGTMSTTVTPPTGDTVAMEIPYRLRANRVVFKDSDIRKVFVTAGFVEPSPLTITAMNCTICNKLGSFVQMDDEYEDELDEL